MKADLVNSPPVFLVVPQHAIPQHVHHLWELLVHEGGSNQKNNHTETERDKQSELNEDALKPETGLVTLFTHWYRYPKPSIGGATPGTKCSQISGTTGCFSIHAFVPTEFKINEVKKSSRFFQKVTFLACLNVSHRTHITTQVNSAMVLNKFMFVTVV